MRIAIVGCTGLVGKKILEVLLERSFHFDELWLVASQRSVGKEILFNQKTYEVISVEQAIELKPDIAIFSAGSSVSIQYAPLFADNGTVVIDNSSAWRMDPTKKLIVPEVNAHVLTKEDKIIANPNCSTIQMIVILSALHKKKKIQRVVVSTYQSVTGTGVKAVNQLMDERKGSSQEKVYPYQIDLNVLPHVDVFQENGYTKEEIKMINETHKILDDDTVKVTSTAVRIPVMGGHSESVNIEFSEAIEPEEVRQILAQEKGVVVQDDPTNNIYPMPLLSEGKDDIFVGRIRKDFSQINSINLWIVSDNLRKGAATNAVQIAEYLIEKKLI